MIALEYSIEQAKRYWECGRKRRHPTKQSADEEAQRLNASGQSGIKAKSYHCSHCYYWHVGRDRVGVKK
jgi:hypothetical protein